MIHMSHVNLMFFLLVDRDVSKKASFIKFHLFYYGYCKLTKCMRFGSCPSHAHSVSNILFSLLDLVATVYKIDAKLTIVKTCW